MPFNQTLDLSDESLMHYLAAKAQLERILGTQLWNSPQKQQTQKLINLVEKLKIEGKQPIASLTEVLNDTTALLNHTMTVDTYRDKAQKVQGNPSLGMKILGGLMIALGALVGAVCFALATVGIHLSGESVVGAGVIAAGIGIFSSGMRSGLSRTMNDVADNYENTAKFN